MAGSAAEARTCVVTGASRGIGLSIARKLALDGIKVVMVARDHDRLRAAADAISAAGGNAETRQCDLADATAVTRVAQEIAADYPAISGLVNNAGISRIELAADTSSETWDRTLQVNVTSVFRFSVTLHDSLKHSGHGAIVNISSIMGIGTMAGLSAYAASKGALQQLTRTLAVEFGPDGIRVNAIAPGFIVTDMFRESHPEARQRNIARAHPLGRAGEPEEVANVTRFLLGPDASFITGALVTVDGGLTCVIGAPSLIT